MRFRGGGDRYVPTRDETNGREGVVKDCARPPCGRLGEGLCNEPLRDRPAERRDRLAYRVSAD